MTCQYTGYYDDEVPETTDMEIEEAYLESLEQTAPAITWESCYCDDDNMCHHCTDALKSKRRAA